MTEVGVEVRRQPSRLELRAFAGLSMASAAISIDLILPAFSRIRSDLGLAVDSSATAGLVTAFFLGMAVGPIPFGLLADRFGRRWILLATCALFVGGALAAAVVPSLHWMLWARFAWGLGSAGLRVIAVATIRDRFVGAHMAREMAFAMAVFISVPVIAPALGSALIHIMPWRGTFVICAGFGTAIALWSLRLPETLSSDRRQPLQLRQVWVAVKAMVHSREALLYTLCSVAIFGAFSSYLATSERVVGDVFHRRSWFPFVFGGTAILMGISSMTVGRNVQRIGVDRLIRWAVISYTTAAVAMYLLSVASDGHPSFWPFMILLSLVLVGYNVLLSNLNSAAMVPVGHVAGTAAAVYATVTTAGAAAIGQRFDKAFDGTVNPFSLAFAVAGVIALVMVLALRRSQRREIR
ncbi:MAG: multidrug effflux MFS transporter [Ilumatobacteraceae bacterium]